MVSHYMVAEKFMAREKATGSRMYTDGDTIYSYGEHWPLATWISDKTVLLNNEKYSVSTSKHYSIVDRVLFRKDGCEIEVIKCKANEIIEAIKNPGEPIIIYREKEVLSIEGVMRVIERYVKKQGVRRFPRRKFYDMIFQMVFKAKL